jgi:tRNA threonylcarbamoyladenosine biosynthesis protein TsaB
MSSVVADTGDRGVHIAIETSTGFGSVAIGGGGRLLGEVGIGVNTRHAESLLPALAFLLDMTRVDRREIAGIVVGAGPGSFTGVRIAAATALGLARGLGVPLFAYSSLAALALDSVDAGPACALFDARRGEVYAGCYDRQPDSDALTTLLEPAALSVTSLLDRLPRPRPTFVGEGAVRYAVELGIAPPPARPPRAAALLRLQQADPDAGRVERAADWEPAYLRASGAERGLAG